MSVRIRVYPQNGMGAGGMYGAQNTQLKLSQQALRNQKQTSNLQLNYERALWEEKLKFAQLQAQSQFGGFGGMGGIPIAAGLGMTGIGGAVPAGFGQVAGYGMNAGFGGMPQLAGGSGQTNVTNQTSTGGNQSVTNSNNYQVSSHISNPNPQGGMFGGFGGFGGWGGGGGFLSSLLGALI